jgi:hypothetical protein
MNILILFIIYAMKLIFIHSQRGNYCGAFPPKDTTSCTNYNTDDTLCCRLYEYTNQLFLSMCYPIQKVDYLALNGEITLNGYHYFLDCGISQGTTCGTIFAPQSYKDCSQFSTSDNSCCYYKYKDDTSCVWLGKPDVGEIHSNGISLICDSTFLITYMARIIFMLFIVIFL